MKINDWRQDYNQIRPHGAIGNRVPMNVTSSDRVQTSTVVKSAAAIESQ